jgi:hypothetical protein
MRMIISPLLHAPMHVPAATPMKWKAAHMPQNMQRLQRRQQRSSQSLLS